MYIAFSNVALLKEDTNVLIKFNKTKYFKGNTKNTDRKSVNG